MKQRSVLVLRCKVVVWQPEILTKGGLIFRVPIAPTIALGKRLTNIADQPWREQTF